MQLHNRWRHTAAESKVEKRYGLQHKRNGKKGKAMILQQVGGKLDVCSPWRPSKLETHTRFADIMVVWTKLSPPALHDGLREKGVGNRATNYRAATSMWQAGLCKGLARTSSAHQEMTIANSMLYPRLLRHKGVSPAQRKREKPHATTPLEAEREKLHFVLGGR